MLLDQLGASDARRMQHRTCSIVAAMLHCLADVSRSPWAVPASLRLVFLCDMPCLLRSLPYVMAQARCS